MTVLPTRDESPQEIWGPIISVFIANTLLYFVGQGVKDNSIVDITWGFMFLIPNAVVWIINGNTTETSIAVNALLLAWAVRMMVYNIKRHKGEDWRYVEMRKGWMEKGQNAYYVLSYLMIYFMQSIFQLLMNAPALFLSIWSTQGIVEPQFIVGFVIAIIGLLMETIADLQLYLFKQNAENKGKFITTGLWRYSRHPNYFGEATFGWGLFIMACSFEKGWITFYSPLITTLLLRYVSGVPILEKEFEKRPGFKEYAEQTNCFLPWIPKKAANTATTSELIVNTNTSPNEPS